MKLIYLKSAWKFDSFDVSFSIKIPFFRVSFTIEPGRSLLQFVTTNCLICTNVCWQRFHNLLKCERTLIVLISGELIEVKTKGINFFLYFMDSKTSNYFLAMDTGNLFCGKLLNIKKSVKYFAVLLDKILTFKNPIEPLSRILNHN